MTLIHTDWYKTLDLVIWGPYKNMSIRGLSSPLHPLHQRCVAVYSCMQLLHSGRIPYRQVTAKLKPRILLYLHMYSQPQNPMLF
jgi:hypothetical protein